MCQKLHAVKRGTRREKQIFYCTNCKKYFSKSLTRKNKNINKILIDHLEGISYRKLPTRYGKITKDKLCKIVNNQTSKFKNNFEITKTFLQELKYSGTLVVDGKYIPVKEFDETMIPLIGKIPRSKKRRKVKNGKVLIWGSDYTTHDIPLHDLAESENGTDFNDYFYNLKSINYPLKSLTVDDKREIFTAVRRYYPDCVIQLCIRHYLAKVNRILTINGVKIQIGAKEKLIEKLFPPNSDSEFIPTTRPNSIKQAAKLANEILSLEFKCEILLDIQDIIESILNAQDYRTALCRIESLEKYFWPKRLEMKKYFPKEHINKVKKLIADFKEHKEYLLNYLKYPQLNIPRTTNLIEGLNSQLELRLNSIRGFETKETAENYINVWIIKRRFTKFSCCRESFKTLNGKTPLECAGADISTIRNWVKWSQK